MNDLGGQTFSFGVFELDVKNRSLLRDGTPVALAPKEFDTLVVLARSRGQLLDKETLIAAVWPDTFVSDGSLARNISVLRKALGDEAIQTLPKKGYRFVPEVRENGNGSNPAEAKPIETLAHVAPARSAPGPSGAKSNWTRFGRYIVQIAGIVLILAVASALLFAYRGRAHRRSSVQPARPVRIAVLPLVNLTGDPNQEFLCDGLTEAMIAELSVLNPERLSVIARTSAMHYKGTTASVSQIGRELNVSYVLEGSVRGSATRAHITIQLVRTEDEAHQWTGQYERDLKEIASVQQEVALAVADEIQVSLNAETNARLRRSVPVDPEAYRDYLLGQFYWNKRDRQSLLTARDYFQRAVDRDPRFAQGWAGLSYGYLLLADFGLPVRPYLAQGRSAARRALDLDENLAQAHTALAYLQMVDEWDWSASEASYKRALELDPNDANTHHWYALYLIGMKRPQEAVKEIRRAMELDPLSLGISYNGGFIYTLAGMRVEAEQQLRRALEIDPNNAVAHGLLGIVYQRSKEYDKSLSEFRAAQRLSGGPVPYLTGVAAVEALAGDRASAVKDLDELLRLREKHQLAASSLAFVYAALGDNQTALDWIDKSLEERSISVIEINDDSLFDGFRSDPRFVEIERRMKLRP